MNVVYLSPGFPPTARHFCEALKARGVRVLSVGDEPPSEVVRQVTHEYVFEPQMNDYQALERAVARLRESYGPIDRIDSNGEHWLMSEARLRERFGVWGIKPRDLARQLSKTCMARLFAEAGILHPPLALASSARSVHALLERHGYPLVFKPDVGSGARDTFRVTNDHELARALSQDLPGHVVQPFVKGDIVTYDGLTDHQGRIVFAISHRYDTGIMQIREGNRDGYYYSLREIPPKLAEVGARAVQAFEIQERFFHLELFENEQGYVALEMNLRPPGGFTTDMMNFASGSNVYELWAKVVLGESPPPDSGPRPFHVAHAGRRNGRTYRAPHDELVSALGSSLVAIEAVPAAFADTMGDVAYLLRSAHLPELERAISLVQSSNRSRPAEGVLAVD